MKNLLMSLILMGSFAAMSAKGGDSYMYWMVKDATYANGVAFDFYAAELYAVKDKDTAHKVFLGAELSNGSGNTVKSVSCEMSAYTGEGWTYMVELYADATETSDPFTQSYIPITYAAALESKAIYSPLDPSGAGIATFSTFNVPEPTSGLLMLIGLCGLALKRKRA